MNPSMKSSLTPMLRHPQRSGQLRRGRRLRLLEQYHVTYIFVGSKEKEKYGDALNELLLQSIGDIVYQDTASGTYILQVQDT